MRDTRTALLFADSVENRWSWELRSEPLIQRAHRILEGFFDEIIVVAREPELLGTLGYDVVADEYEDAGLLGALTTGLKHIKSHYAFAVGADMPFLHARVIRHLYGMRKGWDVVVPRSESGFEPMCAVYSKACVAPMEQRIARGNLKVLDFISEVRTRIVNGEDLFSLDPSGLTFRNVHTKADLDECRLHLARLRSFGPPAVSFVAEVGSGKTTLLEKVIEELSQRGYRVGAVKHDALGFEIDHEGKDSWRLTRAGSAPMVISSKEQLAMVCPNARGEVTLDEVIYKYMTDVDIVITEGGESALLPKIEVHRAGVENKLLCISEDGQVVDHQLIALVSDRSLSSSVPVFPLDNAGPICDFLEEQFLGGA